jgi:hypothetical protein
MFLIGGLSDKREVVMIDHKFKVIIPKTKYYFHVYVFQKNKDMYLHYSKIQKKHPDIMTEKRDYDAIVISLKIERPYLNKKSWKIGEVLFVENKIGSGLIAHECCHMAFWVECLLNDNTEFLKTGTEERFCGLVDRFMRKIVGKFYELGMYDGY